MTWILVLVVGFAVAAVTAATITGVLTALIIFYGLTWLAVQLGQTILLKRETTLTRWFGCIGEQLTQIKSPFFQDPLVKLGLMAGTIILSVCMVRALFDGNNKHP